ncbi:MAG: hypothetical protein JOY99_00700 [Sphingomonadaceae bacterium]|nr:hypothetical protein [Sphingomonadaceae bacterium]
MQEDAGFDIAWDRNGPILIATLRGFWSLETVDGFYAALRNRLAERPGQSFDMVSKMTGFPTQSREVQEAMQKVTQELVPRGFRRGAAVTNSALTRLQANRAAERDNLNRRWFETLDEAIASLRAG